MLGRTEPHFPTPLSCLAPPPTQAKLHYYYRRGEAKTSATGRYRAGPGRWNDIKQRSATTGRKARNLLPNPNHLHTAQSPCHTGECGALREHHAWIQAHRACGRFWLNQEDHGVPPPPAPSPQATHGVASKGNLPWGRGRSTGRAPL